MARKHRRFIEDLKIGPYGRLDGLGLELTLKRAMSNQFAVTAQTADRGLLPWWAPIFRA